MNAACPSYIYKSSRNWGVSSGAWNALHQAMLPQRMRDTYSDMEPETMQPSTLQPQTLRRVDDEGTRVMTVKHGAKSSTRSRAADRVVPSPFPTQAKPMRPVSLEAMRSPMPSEPTWLRPSQNIKLPTTPTSRVFQPFPDFDFSEFEDEEQPSDQMPVVHNYRTLAERLANPMSAEDAQLCWECAQQQQMKMHQMQFAQTMMAPGGYPLESGVRPITVIPKKIETTARIGYARAVSGFLLAVALGATAAAGWSGDITEKDVDRVAMQAQAMAQHFAYGATTARLQTHALKNWK